MLRSPGRPFERARAKIEGSSAGEIRWQVCGTRSMGAFPGPAQLAQPGIAKVNNRPSNRERHRRRWKDLTCRSPVCQASVTTACGRRGKNCLEAKAKRLVELRTRTCTIFFVADSWPRSLCNVLIAWESPLILLPLRGRLPITSSQVSTARPIPADA